MKGARIEWYYLFGAIVFCVAGFEFAFTGWGWLVYLAALLLGLSLINQTPLVSAYFLSLFSGISWIMIARWLPDGINAMNPSYPWLGWVTLLFLASMSAIPYFVGGWIIGRFSWLSSRKHRPFSAAALLSLLVELWPARLPGSLGHALYREITFIQIVEIGGTGFLSFVTYGLGFAAAGMVAKNRASAERLTSLGILIAVLVPTYLFGMIQEKKWSSYFENSAVMRVAYIQPNLPLEYLSTPGSSENSLDSLIDQTHEIILSDSNLDLVAWPEIPIFFSPRNSQSAEDALNKLLGTNQVPLLANADSYPETTLYDRVPFYNTVQLFKGSGKILQEYRKMILVPFGEYLPLEEWLSTPLFRSYLKDVRRYVPGEQVSVISLDNGVQLGTPICLEAHHPELIGSMVNHGANVLINPANDAYFGTSNGAMVDFAITIFRAIEYRVPLIRVTNSGVSAAINQLGEIIPDSMIPQFTASARAVSVHPSPSRSVIVPKYVGMILMSIIMACGSCLRRRNLNLTQVSIS